MLTFILIALGIVVVALAIFIFMQSNEFRVTRSASMTAPAAAVFEQVNELKRWEQWSPWAKRDPAMKMTYSGPPAGTGAGYSWRGNMEVGSGGLTITESHPSDLIRIRLDFLKPFKATNMAEFTFKPEGNQTLMTWTMTGKKNFFAKALHLVMNMDIMVGGDFEKGMAEIKRIVETASAR